MFVLNLHRYPITSQNLSTTLLAIKSKLRTYLLIYERINFIWFVQHVQIYRHTLAKVPIYFLCNYFPNDSIPAL